MKRITLTLLIALPFFLHAQDSLPPLASFADADIDTAISSYPTKIVTLKLRSGEVYRYDFSKTESLDPEKFHGKRFQAMMGISYKFTKTEHPPYYPGGEAAWDKYLQQFMAGHVAALEAAGHGNTMVSFLADFDGNLYEVEAYGPGSQQLKALAAEAVKKSSPWMPAIQNFYKVTCYYKVAVKF